MANDSFYILLQQALVYLCKIFYFYFSVGLVCNGRKDYIQNTFFFTVILNIKLTLLNTLTLLVITQLIDLHSSESDEFNIAMNYKMILCAFML